MAYLERHGSREGSIVTVLINGNTANDLTCDPVESSSRLHTATPGPGSRPARVWRSSSTSEAPLIWEGFHLPPVIYTQAFPSLSTTHLILHCCCYLAAPVVSDSVRPHGLYPTRLLHLWDSPGKSAGVGCHSLLQGIFPTQGSKPGLLHCRQILYHWATREALFYTK